MKKRILLFVAIMAMLVCVFAISASAVTPNNEGETFVAADGTNLALYDTEGKALAWFYDSTTAEYVPYRVGIDFTVSLNSGREWLPASVISDTDGDNSTTFPYTTSNMVLLNGRDYAAFTYISGSWKDLPIQAIYVNNNFRWINKSTFNGNTTLKVFDIPKDTESSLHFGGSAFANAKALEYIYIPVNSYFENTSTFEYSGLKSAEFYDQWTGAMKGYDFYCCYSLETVKLPSTLTEIPKYSFAFKSVVNDNTTNFKIDIPSSVKSIGEKAFQNNTSLVEINFASTKNLTSIDSPAFENCKRLPKVVLPEGLVTLGNCAFLNCASLTSVTFPTTLTTLNGNNHFWKTALTEVIGLENTSLTTISESMFRGVTSWKPDVIKVPNTVTTIKTFGFADIPAKKIILGSNVVSINNEAFKGCKSVV